MADFNILRRYKFRLTLALFVCTAVLFLAPGLCAPAYANADDLVSFNSYIFGKLTAPASQLENTAILSGVTKPVESTFDAIRTLVGSAPKDTVVTVSIYTPQGDKLEPYALAREYALTVGQSGMFSKTIDLDMGQNFLCVTFTRGSSETVYMALLNRKDIEIKKELEQGVVPGGDINILQLEHVKP